MGDDILDDVLTLGTVLPVMDKPAESISNDLILPLCFILLPLFSFNIRERKLGSGTPGILSLRNRERIPHLELGGVNGAPLDVCGTLVLPLEWRRVCRELLELQKGCEGPFGSSRG